MQRGEELRGHLVDSQGLRRGVSIPVDEKLRVLRPRAGSDAPASTSLDDAGRKIRASLERIGQWVGTPRNLEAIVEAAEPLHPSIRVMDQPYSRVFSLTSFPTALGDAVECDARARGAVPPDPLPLEYGEAFGMTFRFRTQGGDAPVLRLLWRKEDGAWRVTSYDVEVP